MTTTEKLQALELIWADLIRNQAKLKSPAWHRRALKERDELVKSGKERPMDWERAKSLLRKP
jgi:hypothetical protein